MRFRNSRLQLCSAVALAAALGLAGVPAEATPQPLPPLSVPSAGESDLTSFADANPAENITIDWMVIDAAPLGFAGQNAYLYQLENTTLSGSELDLFTVSFDASVTVIAAFHLPGDNLDAPTGFHPAHSLAGEEDPFGFFAGVPIATDIAASGTNVSWLFPHGFFLAPGLQSETLVLISPDDPGYVVGMVANTSPPSPWGSLAANSEMVAGPIQDVGPIPEPGALTLFGAGLLVAGASLRRTRRSS
jgi:hypothetical protein